MQIKIPPKSSPISSIFVYEVAVGTALEGRPPHRSGLEELPHPALTSGDERRGVDSDTGVVCRAWEAIG